MAQKRTKSELITLVDGKPVLNSEIAYQLAEFEKQKIFINEQQKRLKRAILKEMEAKGIMELDSDFARIKCFPFDYRLEIEVK